MLDRSMKLNQWPFAVALVLLATAVGCSSNPTPPRADAGVVTDIVTVDVPVDIPVDVPVRCTSNAMCTTQPGRPICDVSTGGCVSCAQMASACTAAQYCNAATGACVAGCANDMGCMGSAGDGGVGDAGAAPARCDTVTHTCVQCVTDEHCPSGTLCRGSVCVMGCTATRACPTGQSCCDGACLDSATNVAACGACGTVCRTANGVPACSGGVCALGACTAPYDNCDSNVANGCETNTQTEPAHCGMCGHACETRANATTTCTSGACGFTCNTGFADCDGDASNGCEVDTRTSASNCARCGRACPTTGGTAVCTDGVCGIGVCGMGFENCDSDMTNGCEANVRTSVTNCGACGTVAPTRPNATATCVAGVPGIDCNDGFGDCDGMAANGCEVNLTSDPTHCGVCPTACPSGPGAAASCSGGRCGLTCATGRGDCDGVSSNGCEVDLNTNISNCRSCDAACVAGPSSTAVCTAGVCSITCGAGFADCDANPANGCEINTRISVTNCGACGRVCPSGNVCNDSVCVAPCPGVQTRCSGTCVSLLTDNSNCGGCGVVCGTGSTCTDGVCRCPLGGQPTGGTSCGAACVDVLSDASNCGVCGNACGTGNTCVRGVCRCSLSGAPIGITCGGACVDPIADRTNCGRCGNACTSGEVCNIGVCRCPVGGVTCSGVCTDTNIDRSNCGACGTVCGATQECASGVCRACTAGLTFCGGACVATASSNTNCGACGNVCGTGLTCVAGACTDTPPTRYRAELTTTLTFVDACAAPGALTFLSGADDSAASTPLPFAFRYWATDMPSGSPINITSNGWIGMNGVMTATYAFPLPSTSNPYGVVAPYEGDDQNRGPQCVAIVGTAPNRRWVHEWNDSHHCCGEMAVHTTYEIILTETTNTIDFVYQLMDGARSQNVGIMDQSGATAVGACPGGGTLCTPVAGQHYRFFPIP